MKSALLIIDVQQSLCTGMEAAFDVDRVVEKINEVARKARAAGAPVVLIQHEEAEGSLRYRTSGWQLYDKLETHPQDLRIRKAGSDAFHQTELFSLLQSLDIAKLIVCGLQSDFCVDSTVRRSLALGYPVDLISDGHSTVDNGVLAAAQISAHHNVTLGSLGSYGPRATPIPAADVRIDM